MIWKTLLAKPGIPSCNGVTTPASGGGVVVRSFASLSTGKSRIDAKGHMANWRIDAMKRSISNAVALLALEAFQP